MSVENAQGWAGIIYRESLRNKFWGFFFVSIAHFKQQAVVCGEGGGSFFRILH